MTTITILPTRIEIDVSEAMRPTRVDYIINLSTESYSDTIGGGTTYVEGPELEPMINKLRDELIRSINTNLGLEIQGTANTQPKEEEL